MSHNHTNQMISQVSFLPTATTYSQPTAINKVEKRLAFYNKIDFREMETEAFKDILKSQMGKFTCDVDYCLRGLENFARSNEGKQNRINRQVFVRTVLQEQAKNRGIDNKEHSISTLSMKLSYENKIQARERGIFDETHSRIVRTILYKDMHHQSKVVDNKVSTARAA